jgi:hypothetical protein
LSHVACRLFLYPIIHFPGTKKPGRFLAQVGGWIKT